MLTEFRTELVNITLSDRVFAFGDGLYLDPQVGTSGNVKLNEGGERGEGSTNSRVRVASIMSAYDVHFEKNKGGNAADGEGGGKRRCEKKR